MSRLGVIENADHRHSGCSLLSLRNKRTHAALAGTARAGAADFRKTVVFCAVSHTIQTPTSECALPAGWLGKQTGKCEAHASCASDPRLHGSSRHSLQLCQLVHRFELS